MSVYCYVLNKKDNVCIALKDLKPEEIIQVGTVKIKILEEIPFGFKVSLTNIPMGTAIIKDGYPIGTATKDIPAGALVHIHNVKSSRSKEWGV